MYKNSMIANGIREPPTLLILSSISRTYQWKPTRYAHSPILCLGPTVYLLLSDTYLFLLV